VSIYFIQYSNAKQFFMQSYQTSFKNTEATDKISWNLQEDKDF